MSDILVNEIADLKARVGELERRMNAVKAQLPEGALDRQAHPMPSDDGEAATDNPDDPANFGGGPMGDEEPDEAPQETMRGPRSSRSVR